MSWRIVSRWTNSLSKDKPLESVILQKGDIKVRFWFDTVSGHMTGSEKYYARTGKPCGGVISKECWDFAAMLSYNDVARRKRLRDENLKDERIG